MDRVSIEVFIDYLYNVTVSTCTIYHFSVLKRLNFISKDRLYVYIYISIHMISYVPWLVVKDGVLLTYNR
jgi:hypothetical protein